MSTKNNGSRKPLMKMKYPILFNNRTEDFAGIDIFYKFWKELEIWVQTMLIECPKEWHDKWFTMSKKGYITQNKIGYNYMTQA